MCSGPTEVFLEEQNYSNFLSNLPDRIRNLISNIVAVILIAMLAMLLYISYRSIVSRYSGVNESGFIMNTNFEIKVNGAGASGHVKAALERVRDIAKLIDYASDSSELSSINNMAGIAAVAVSHDTFDVVDKALMFSRRSAGTYDLTIGPLVDIWAPSFRTKKDIPSGNELVYAQHLVNYGNVVINPNDETVKLMYAGMKIDLDGLAKGYAISKAREILVDRGVKSALISAGSSIAAIGDDRGRPWRVAIHHPRRPDELVGMLELQAGQAVSTVGDFENYFELNGVRYHHMLNPSTGLPADACQSVTIVCNDAAQADLLANAVFVMGPDRGTQFVKSFPETYAVIIDKDGKTVVSDGLKLER